MSTPKRSRGRRTTGHRQSSPIDLTDGTPGSIVVDKAQRPPPTPNSNKSSTSTVSSSTGSIFDEIASERPGTPLTPPVSNEPEFLGPEDDPFQANLQETYPSQKLELAVRNTPPKKSRVSAKGRVQRATGSPAAPSRRHSRAVSSTERLENKSSDIEATGNLLSAPSTSRERTCSAPAAPTNRQPRPEQVETSNLHEPDTPMPGAFGSENSDVEFQTESTISGEESNGPLMSAEDVAECQADTSLHQSISETDNADETPRLHFIRYRKKTSPPTKEAINEEIIGFLKKRKSARVRAKVLEPGVVYLQGCAEAEGHIKIGITKNGAYKRLDDWETCCNIKLRLDSHSEMNSFDHHQVVESIIMIELSEFRRKSKCPNSQTIHIEWYETTAKQAMDHIMKWQRWITFNHPFDAFGALTPYWLWRVNALPKNLDKLKWETWTRPPWYDFWIVYHWDVLKRHLARKDDRFITHGIIMLLMAYILAGRAAAAWGFLALIAL